jgi:hypothetical protein
MSAHSASLPGLGESRLLAISPGGLLASGMLYRCEDLGKRQHLIAMISLTMDKTTCTHMPLTAGTQVLKLIPSSPDIATLLKEHA